MPRNGSFRTALLGVLAVAAAVRFAHLAGTTFWIDEVFESSLIHAPAGGFWAALRLDAVHPPLDYLVGRGVARLGLPDPWGRSASVVWGVASIAALGALVRRRGGPRAALLTAALLAVAPFHVRYSQELRPYALGTFLTCLSLLLLDRALERPTAARGAALFASLLATAYALYLAGLSAAIGGAAMVATDAFSPDSGRRAAARRIARLSIPGAAALAILYAPWWPAVRSASQRISRRSGPAVDFRRLRLMFAFFTVSPKQEGWAFGPRFLYLVAFAAAIALLAAGTAVALRRPALRFLPVWGFLGIGAVEALRALSPSFGAFRYALPSGIALAAIAAVAIDALLAKSLRAGAAALAFTLGFQAWALADYYREGRYDWSRELAFLRARPESETIFTSAHNPQYCLAYYLCGPEWLTDGHRCGRPLVNLEGDTRPLEAMKGAGRRFSLVLDGMPASAAPRAWARGYPTFEFPEAEGTVVAIVSPREAR